jgi:hypothetical protein
MLYSSFLEIMTLSKNKEKYPKISPSSVFEFLKNIAHNKIFCEIGCSSGDLLSYVSENAKEVLGFEANKHFAKEAQRREYKCKSHIFNKVVRFRGDDIWDDIKTPYKAEFGNDEQKKKWGITFEPDIFYYWRGGVNWNTGMFESLHTRFPNSTVIVAADPGCEHQEHTILKLQEKYGGEIIKLPNDEEIKRRDHFYLYVK